MVHKHSQDGRLLSKLKAIIGKAFRNNTLKRDEESILEMATIAIRDKVLMIIKGLLNQDKAKTVANKVRRINSSIARQMSRPSGIFGGRGCTSRV